MPRIVYSRLLDGFRKYTIYRCQNSMYILETHSLCVHKMILQDRSENNIWMFKGQLYQETEIFLQDGICTEQVII